MSELKPCPFCGGMVYLVYTSVDGRFRFFHYAKSKGECAVDVLILKYGPKSINEAIEAWNRRVKE